MNCKSCNASISNDAKYCSQCGGKVVNNRLSLKGTWNEFVGPVFSWDNHFGKTFKDLLLKPEKVLNAYIDGARKKYFAPFAFLMVYASISFVFYKIFPFDGSMLVADYNSKGSEISIELTTKFFNFIFEYYNFMVILTIPIFSLITYFTFRKFKNNFSEHLVFNSYLIAFTGFISLLLQILLINLLSTDFNSFLLISYLMIFIYYNFVFIRMYQLNFKTTLILNLRFVLVLIAIYVSTVVFSILTILLFKTVVG